MIYSEQSLTAGTVFNVKITYKTRGGGRKIRKVRTSKTMKHLSCISDTNNVNYKIDSVLPNNGIVTEVRKYLIETVLLLLAIQQKIP